MGSVKHTEGKYVVYRLHYTKDLTHDHRRYHHDDLPHARLTDYRLWLPLFQACTTLRKLLWSHYHFGFGIASVLQLILYCFQLAFFFA